MSQVMTRDEAVAFVREWNKSFHDGKCIEEPTEKDGVLFWRVGWNASHEFSVGVGPDGRLYRRAVSADEEDWEQGQGDSITEIKSLDGYWGHF